MYGAIKYRESFKANAKARIVMKRLSIDVAEQRLAESLPQAGSPGEGSEVPHSKKGGKPDNGDRKFGTWSKSGDAKFDGSPKPLKVDMPKAGKGGDLIGKPISPTTSPKSAGTAKTGTGAAKSVKQPNMAVTKKGSPSLIDDAGQLFPDMGKAHLSIKKASAKGSESELLGAGKISVATVKYAEPKFVKPEFGWGLLGSKSPQKTVAETINGVVRVSVGGKTRRAFQAATPKLVAEACKEYVSVGVSPTVSIEVGDRPAYGDRRLRASLFSYAHALHHGVAESAGRMLQAGFERFVKLIEAEAKGYRGGRSKWIAECALPAFKQARRLVVAAYQGRVQAFEAIAKLDNEARRIVVGAIDARHAAAAAYDRLVAEAGFARVKHVTVGGEKFLPEAAGKGLFSSFPKQIELKLDGEPPQTKKSKTGDKSEVKADKPETAKIGTASAKGVTRASGKPGESAKAVGGDQWTKASAAANKAAPTTKAKDVVPPKAGAPEFPKNSRLDEVDRISAKAMKILGELHAQAQPGQKAKLAAMIEKIKGDEDLDKNEAAILDEVLKKAMR